ncbi:hypothetical protein [Mesonia maritima]|uniref:Outer membrane protein beta-barrel domain-containing protein n=1 Tax=Mesonia maritima TaxID=1793873 RepID=A0ABU1K6H1_9FLAO|nr:hypothetical protein [Mesonia maritima]MDR6301194.1 hypothetical protein [Mesonia maritima]
MNSPINIFIFVVFFGISAHLFSQEENNKFPQDDHYIVFKFGYTQPIAVGDNFASKTFTNITGIDAEVFFNLSDGQFLLGLHYGNTYNRIKNNELVGGQNKTNTFFIGPLLGYQFYPRNDFRFMISAGVGAVKYKNFLNDDFRIVADTGTTVWFNPEFSYHFWKVLGVYFSPNFRKDFLSIEAPEPIQGFFNSTNYINLKLGIRLLL